MVTQTQTVWKFLSLAPNAQRGGDAVEIREPRRNWKQLKQLKLLAESSAEPASRVSWADSEDIVRSEN